MYLISRYFLLVSCPTLDIPYTRQLIFQQYKVKILYLVAKCEFTLTMIFGLNVQETMIIMDRANILHTEMTIPIS